MMQVLNWLGEHPLLGLAFALIICSAISGIVRISVGSCQCNCECDDEDEDD